MFFFRRRSRPAIGLILVLFVVVTFLMYWRVAPLAPEPADDAAESDLQLLRVENDMLHEKIAQLEQRYEHMQQPFTLPSVTPPSSPAVVHRSTATVILTHKRADYLNRTLLGVLRYLPDDMALFVSQDDSNDAVTALIQSHSDRVVHLHNHPRWALPPKNASVSHRPYYFIALHYRFVFMQLFDHYRYDQLIVLEDDMDIASDLFEYFAATSVLLEQDPTLFCVSAWNDNGKSEFVSDPEALRRTNFFPGLGWLLTRQLWNELRPHWPAAFWDDWLRESVQRRNRDCIYPEISRTFTFGEQGSSSGQFYRDFLAYIRLNSQPQPFSKLDLSYLLKSRWDADWNERLQEAALLELTVEELQRRKVRNRRVSVYYTDEDDFHRIAKQLGIMSDRKAGIPRTAYDGVVLIRFGATEAYIRPRDKGS